MGGSIEHVWSLVAQKNFDNRKECKPDLDTIQGVFNGLSARVDVFRGWRVLASRCTER